MSSGAGWWLVAAALSQVEGRLATRVRAHGTDPEQGRGCLLSGPWASSGPPLWASSLHSLSPLFPPICLMGGAVWGYELLRVRLWDALCMGNPQECSVSVHLLLRILLILPRKG